MIGVRAHVCFGFLQVLWWLVVAVASDAADARPVQPTELTQALRSVGGAAPQAVDLPDAMGARNGEDRTVQVPSYLMRADLGPEPTQIALYLPGIFSSARIAVNGHTVEDRIREPLPGPLRGADRIVLVPIPDGLLRPGFNDVEVVLAAPRATSLSRVWIGDAEALRRAHDRKVFLAVTGPIISAAVIAALSLCVLVLWARSPVESLYGYFGIGGLLWALHTVWTVLPDPILGPPHLSIWWTMGYPFFVTPLVIFCVRLAQWRLPRFERLLWLGILAGPVMLYASHGAGHLESALVYWRLVWLGAVTIGVAAVGRYAMQQRNARGVLLLATGALALAFGMRDWLLDRELSDNNPVFLTSYSGLLFFPLVAWILIDGFVRTARELKRLNLELEGRVASKSAELRGALEEMRIAKDAAEHANRAKSTFLAAASHDLRQPAHALGLYLEALRAGPASHEQGVVIGRMAAAVTALDTMFNALLDISRMDARALEVDVHPFALRPLLHRVADSFAGAATEKNLRLSVRLSRAMTERNALSDPLLLERIIRNLLDNAIKHTDVGGVLLSCRMRGGMAGHWRIEVWDTGPGIPAEARDRVFEEFFQLGNRERNRAAGLGLGLSIVRRLADLLEHPLQLVSTVGRGTRFVLDVPMTADAHRVMADPQMRTLKLLRVGVVDDDPEVRTAMRALLERWGCVVIAAASAEELIAGLQAHRGARPQAVIVDYQLGDGRNGVEAIAALRQAFGAFLPALVVSGVSAPERLAQLNASGLQWLIKPVPPARLWQWLSQAASPARPSVQRQQHPVDA